MPRTELSKNGRVLFFSLFSFFLVFFSVFSFFSLEKHGFSSGQHFAEQTSAPQKLRRAKFCSTELPRSKILLHALGLCERALVVAGERTGVLLVEPHVLDERYVAFRLTYWQR